MYIDILTIFPGMFPGPLGESILKRAQEKGLITLRVHDIRAFARDKHHMVDDYPFGGGPGMVMKPEPVFEAVEYVLSLPPEGVKARVVLMTPQGRTFRQDVAVELAREERLVIVCGHYEGVDERIREALIDDEISIGDYVLTGGELAAMVVIDATARMIPGVLKEEESAIQESFYSGILDHPHYTRPREYRGMAVPEVLLSGNHAEIAKWRRRQALIRTFERRPDLLESAPLSAEDLMFVEELKRKKLEHQGVT